MSRDKRVGAVALVALAVAAAVLASRGPAPAQQQGPAAREAGGEKGGAKSESADVAAIRKSTAEFVKAFNAGEAKAAAAQWTKDGEYTGPDGETIRGRAVLEKNYADFFRKYPGARLEGRVESVRLLGRHTAVEEGTLRVRLPGEPAPEDVRYSALHIRDGDTWRVATVREWVPDAAAQASLKDLEWLIGDWEARGKDTEVRTDYRWGDDKLTIRCRYTVKKDGQVVAAGTQVIGRDPARGLRSWLFDRSGAFGESAWARDGDRWVIDAAGSLPDGSEMTAVNLLVPIDRDTFTWQSTERTVAGNSMPDVPPVRVARVKGGK
jgi:uncharacterized protein (TIGR02246 family)